MSTFNVNKEAERRQAERRQGDRRAVPPEAQDLARASQATHMAIMALAAAQDRLEGLRKDRATTDRDMSDAATRYREVEKLVQRCVDQEVAAHRKMLKDLTSSPASITIGVSRNPQPEGAHDAQRNP